MRMWNVNPKFLCKKHLLGEHVEMHMFIGTINKGKSIAGFIRDGLVETGKIIYRHRALVKEMLCRGYKHKSELKCNTAINSEGHVNEKENIEELKRRCPECRERINKYSKETI